MTNKSIYVNKHINISKKIMLIELGDYRHNIKLTLHTCSNPITISYRRKYINITKIDKDTEDTVLITKKSTTIETTDQLIN